MQHLLQRYLIAVEGQTVSPDSRHLEGEQKPDNSREQQHKPLVLIETPETTNFSKSFKMFVIYDMLSQYLFHNISLLDKKAVFDPKKCSSIVPQRYNSYNNSNYKPIRASG